MISFVSPTVSEQARANASSAICILMPLGCFTVSFENGTAEKRRKIGRLVEFSDKWIFFSFSLSGNNSS